MSVIQRVSVLGAGVLGGQIAWHTAFKGKDVCVFDISAEALARCRENHALYADIYRAELSASDDDISATQSRLSYTDSLAEAASGADLVIEAVPEDPAVKNAVYAELAPLLPEHTLIATNSSTLLPRDFAEVTGRPEKYCALHYANLIWRMNLTEIMAHPGTSKETLAAVTEFAIDTGMVPIPVCKEQNGYVLNTWLGALLNAAQTLVTNGVATPEVVDRTYMLANRGCAVGPMGLIDVIGMNTVYNINMHWGTLFNDPQVLANAAYLKNNFIDKGLLGTQTGQGYYSYPDPAFLRPGFLSVPDKSVIDEIVDQVALPPGL